MSDQVPTSELLARVREAAANNLQFPSDDTGSLRERALSSINSSKLPEGETCGKCCNYESYCRMAFRSSAGVLNPDTTICAFTPQKFNDPMHVEGRLRWRHKPR